LTVTGRIWVEDDPPKEIQTKTIEAMSITTATMPQLSKTLSRIFLWSSASSLNVEMQINHSNVI